MCAITYICLSLFLPLFYCMCCCCCCVCTHTQYVLHLGQRPPCDPGRASFALIKVMTFPKPGNRAFADIIITSLFLYFARSLTFTLSLSLSRTPALMAYIQKSLEILTALGTNIAGRLSQRIRYYKIFGSPLSVSLLPSCFFHIFHSSLIISLSYRRRERNVASDSAFRK